MPELIEAKNNGTLQGIYFNPSDKELENILTQYLVNLGRISGSEEIDVELRTIIPIANYERENSIISTLTGPITGQEKYHPVFVWNNSFKSDRVSTDEDFRNIVRHEITHVDDNHSGIKYYGELVDMTQLSDGFKLNLREIRAIATEIDYALTHPDGMFSGNYMIFSFAKFIQHRDGLCPINDYEQKIKDNQLAEIPFSVNIGQDIVRASHNSFGTEIAIPYTNFEFERLCP